MPTKLAVPVINDTALMDTYIEERNQPNRTYFENYKDSWNERYEEYIINHGNPSSIAFSNVEAVDKTKFINLYKSPTGTIESDIIDKIEDHDLSYCPFCSGMGVPDTLDHFLPKDDYPEYSIFSKNLIPACDSCNRLKSTKTVDDNGEKMFFHPYYDNINAYEIYKLDILPPYDIAPDFTLEINPAIPEDIRYIAEKQIRELKVEKRFRKHFKGEYKRLKKEVLKNKENANILLVDLVNIFYSKAQGVSMNFWDTVIYKAVLANDDLLAYLDALEEENNENN